VIWLEVEQSTKCDREGWVYSSKATDVLQYVHRWTITEIPSYLMYCLIYRNICFFDVCMNVCSAIILCARMLTESSLRLS